MSRTVRKFVERQASGNLGSVSPMSSIPQSYPRSRAKQGGTKTEPSTRPTNRPAGPALAQSLIQYAGLAA